MVGIVKRLRPRVVAPVYVGSNPTTHPIKFNNSYVDIGVSPSGKATDSDSVIRRFESCYPSQLRRHSQVVRHRSAKPLFAGSNPAVASKEQERNVEISAFLFFYYHGLAPLGSSHSPLSGQAAGELWEKCGCFNPKRVRRLRL